jgi:cobalt-zinc-cadmium efflux system outer membrane protein
LRGTLRDREEAAAVFRAESSMRRIRFPALALASLVSLTGGCASTSERATGSIDALLEVRGAPSISGSAREAEWSAEADEKLVAERTREPITLRRAVEIAFLRSPTIRETYAALSISQAEVIEASSVPMPTFGYASLESASGGKQITRSVALSLTDLLFLPARVRSARAGAEAARQRLASGLIELQADVESAWYEYVAALQSARMRAAAARVAEASAEYARRLHDAGNLPPRALALEIAEASEARIVAARAGVAAIEARAAFATMVGLSTRDDWQVAPGLPALPPDGPGTSAIEAAHSSRLDIAAARREVAALESGWRVARWWRWFGDVEIGHEREIHDGERLRGPTFSLGIPILNWNRSAVLKARGALELGRARLAQLELQAGNDMSAGLDRLATTREIAETYRAALVPQRQAVAQRTLEELNFMNTDAFQALQARRSQYEAYGEYIDAVRDFWLARVELRRATGGAFGTEDVSPGAILELDEPAAAPASDAHGEHR